MSSFDYIWQLFYGRGSFLRQKAAAAAEWEKYSLDEQRIIYRCIRDKLARGDFVHYNPAIAIKENAPRKRKNNSQILTFQKYYEIYHTTEERDGYRKLFIPDKQTTVFIRQEKTVLSTRSQN